MAILMIAMVDPVPYNGILFKDTLRFFDCELQKNSLFTIIRISQSKSDLRYWVFYFMLVLE